MHPDDDKLSRAVSSIDLNAALVASQNDTNSSRTIRGNFTNNHDEHNHETQTESTRVLEVNINGIVTPSSKGTPSPPPPTPDFVNEYPHLDGAEEIKRQGEDGAARAEHDGPGKQQKKKSKKNKSGKKLKKVVTGFEGLSIHRTQSNK